MKYAAHNRTMLKSMLRALWSERSFRIWFCAKSFFLLYKLELYRAYYLKYLLDLNVESNARTKNNKSSLLRFGAWVQTRSHRGTVLLQCYSFFKMVMIFVLVFSFLFCLTVSIGFFSIRRIRFCSRYCDLWKSPVRLSEQSFCRAASPILTLVGSDFEVWFLEIASWRSRRIASRLLPRTKMFLTWFAW